MQPNRVGVRDTGSKKAVDMLVRMIKTKTNISCSVLHKIGELHIGPDALTHLFEVASGLKSMVLGENEILSQIKFGHSFCMSLVQQAPY